MQREKMKLKNAVSIYIKANDFKIQSLDFFLQREKFNK